MSNSLRSATLTERKPPPTGVVIGPFNATPVSLIASRTSGGSGLPPCFSITSAPASRTSHSSSAPVASRTRLVASVSSGPVPSPGMRTTLCAIAASVAERSLGSGGEPRRGSGAGGRARRGRFGAGARVVADRVGRRARGRGAQRRLPGAGARFSRHRHVPLAGQGRAVAARSRRREPRSARFRASVTRAALPRAPEHGQLSAAAPAQDARGRGRKPGRAPARGAGAEERLGAARHDRPSRGAGRGRRRRRRAAQGSRKRRPGPEAQGSGKALARTARADASLNLAPAGRADAPLPAPFECSLLQARGDHEPAGCEGADRGDCDVRIEVHSYFLACFACFKRRACGCAWKYNSRRLRSDTWV